MAKLKAADAEALVERALASGIITRGGGGWLSFGDVRLGQGAAKAAAKLVDDDAVAVSIAAAIAVKEQGGGSAGSGTLGGASSSGAGPETVTKEHGAGHPATTTPAKADATYIVVKAKAVRGRWRAGRFFTRVETTIAFDQLDGTEICALENDPELSVNYKKEE